MKASSSSGSHEKLFLSAGHGFIIWFLVIPLFGVVAPLLVISLDAENRYLITVYNLWAEIRHALVIFIIGFISSLVGYLSIRAKSDSPIATINASMPNLLWAVSLFLIVASISLGGEASIIANIEALSSKVIGISSTQTITFALLPFLGLSSFLIVVSLDGSSSVKRRSIAILQLGITAAICFAVGSRSRAIAALLAPTIFLIGSPGRKWKYLIPGAIVAVAVSFVGDQVRRESQGVTFQSVESPLVLFIGSFSVIDSIAVAVAIEDQAPESLSASIWNIIQWILPRSIIPNKDLTASVLARYIFEGDTLGGITLSNYGELYFFFGMTGVILGGILLGLMSKKYICISLRGGAVGAAAFYICFNQTFVSSRNGFINDLPDFIILNAIFALLVFQDRFFEKKIPELSRTH